MSRYEILERDCVLVLGRWVAVEAISVACGLRGEHKRSCLLGGDKFVSDGNGGWLRISKERHRCLCPCHDPMLRGET